MAKSKKKLKKKKNQETISAEIELYKEIKNSNHMI